MNHIFNYMVMPCIFVLLYRKFIIDHFVYIWMACCWLGCGPDMALVWPAASIHMFMCMASRVYKKLFLHFAGEIWIICWQKKNSHQRKLWAEKRREPYVYVCATNIHTRAVWRKVNGFYRPLVAGVSECFSFASTFGSSIFMPCHRSGSARQQRALNAFEPIRVRRGGHGLTEYEFYYTHEFEVLWIRGRSREHRAHKKWTNRKKNTSSRSSSNSSEESCRRAGAVATTTWMLLLPDGNGWLWYILLPHVFHVFATSNAKELSNRIINGTSALNKNGLHCAAVHVWTQWGFFFVVAHNILHNTHR